MTFLELQDMVLRRFKSSLRTSVKTWLNDALDVIYGLDEWTFRDGRAAVTVTANSDTVNALPSDFGVPRELYNEDGDRLCYLPPDEFLRNYQSVTDTGTVEHWTNLGGTLLVGPIPDTTSAAFELLYERAPGYYVSTTLNGAATLPTATIVVTAVSRFTSTGTLRVGGQLVTYTGTQTSPSIAFTGCSGGSGVISTGSTVRSENAYAGAMTDDTDIPSLPDNTHMALVFGAQVTGQALESDPTAPGTQAQFDKRIQAMRRNYLARRRGAGRQWGNGREEAWQ